MKKIILWNGILFKNCLAFILSLERLRALTFRHVYFKGLLIGIITLLACQLTLGKSRPDWVDSGISKQKDRTAKFYVGRSAPQPSENLAFEQAMADARRQAIAENFGVQLRMKSQAVQSNGNWSATQEANEETAKIQVIGLEQEDIYFESTTNGRTDEINCWILIRYPQVEINKERHRLASLQLNGESIFQGTNDFGSLGDARSDTKMGTLRIQTSPPGLQVRIDNYSEAFGQKLVTPLKIGLPVGEHIIEIDDPRYEMIRENISISENSINLMDKNMVIAKADLKITTNPSGAKILLNGKTYTSPTGLLHLPATKTLKVEIAHPEAKSKWRGEWVLTKDSSESKFIELELRNALLSVATVPAGARIFIDEVEMGKTPLTFPVKPNVTATLRVAKEGYSDQTVTLQPIRGGGAKVYPKLHLEKIPEPKEEDRTPDQRKDSRASWNDQTYYPSRLKSFLAEEDGDHKRIEWEIYGGVAEDKFLDKSKPIGLIGAGFYFKANGRLHLRLSTDIGKQTDYFDNGSLTIERREFKYGFDVLLSKYENISFLAGAMLFNIESSYQFEPKSTVGNVKSRNDNSQSGFQLFYALDLPANTTYREPLRFIRFSHYFGTGTNSWGKLGSSTFQILSLGLIFEFEP